jgi:hypothetical protein
MVRVLFASGGLHNPLSRAWVLSLRAMGHSVAHVSFETAVERSFRSHIRSAAEECPQGGALWRRAPGPLSATEASGIACALGGPPQVIIAWWGVAGMRYGRWAAAGSRAPVVLCVDTFPNAAFLPTEAREVIALQRERRHIAGAVFVSAEMRERFTRLGRLGDIPSWSGPQPLPLAMHADEGSLGIRPRSLIFTGRADLLWSRDKRMAKDRIGPVLRSLADAGLDVHVNSADMSGGHGVEGFRTYDALTNDEVLAGGLSRLTASFAGQLATYAIPNGTISRRVDAGLSTRFSMGIASAAPIFVPRRSGAAASWVAKTGVGFLYDDPAEVAEVILRKPGALELTRTAWRKKHVSWSAEGVASDFSAFLEAVACP